MTDQTQTAAATLVGLSAECLAAAPDNADIVIRLGTGLEEVLTESTDAPDDVRQSLFVVLEALQSLHEGDGLEPAETMDLIATILAAAGQRLGDDIDDEDEATLAEATESLKAMLSSCPEEDVNATDVSDQAE